MLLILRETFLGASRFEDFMARLPISRAALSSRLAMLRDAELLEREPPAAKRAVYRLTRKGTALEPVYRAIGDWSAEHLFTEDDSPRRWEEWPAYQS